MRMYDLIEKKKRGGELTDEEILFMIRSFVEGNIPDYQMSAMLMAICFQGMTEHETAKMTLAMRDSGDVIDLSPIHGVKVDKHSTGGVGDKTTLIVAPIAAACGARIAKMSGRGLGHTGGTIDKLESIPGFRIALSEEEFFNIVNTTGLSVIGQTGNLVPADKKLYALRDVTATVDCLPLIASSIMSKKLAAGSDAILLDVKTGSGAFMKTMEDAIRLAETMVAIGEHAGKRTVAMITEMGIPLGRAIGNSLEVIEAIQTLKGEGPKDLYAVCRSLAAEMLILAGVCDEASASAAVDDAITSGRALAALRAMVAAQGGDVSVINDTERFAKAACCYEVRAAQSGYVCHMDAEQIGIASMKLGAGRARKEDALDYSAGIILQKKYGDKVEAGDVLATLFAGREELFPDAAATLQAAYRFAEEEPSPAQLIYAKVDRDGVTKL